ncbi:MAG: multidrug efflux SMR transporter [Deltaproteobacteria bacterium]|nr:multidrug efflux SMR transporter [Deltaproteobacteria bacterium]
MAWALLIFAGFLEILWAVSLRYTDGLTNIYWGAVTILSGLASFYCLAQAIKTIPLGTGYAVWTGIGATGTAILGIALFAESAALPRLACMGLIVAGIIGLKLTST